MVSTATAEPLAATASRIDHWILVEYRGPWRRDVLGGSLLSPELKRHLRAQLAALPHARLLFVKQPARRSQSGRQVFFGSSRPGEERFFLMAEMAAKALPVVPQDLAPEHITDQARRRPREARTRLVEFVDRAGATDAWLAGLVQLGEAGELEKIRAGRMRIKAQESVLLNRASPLAPA